MSDISQGPGWWQAADLKWYPPELHADYVAPPPAVTPTLPPAPTPPTLPPPPPLTTTQSPVTTKGPSGQRKVGLVLAGLGLLAIAVEMVAAFIGGMTPALALPILAALVITGVTIAVRSGRTPALRILLIAEVLVVIWMAAATGYILPRLFFGTGYPGGVAGSSTGMAPAGAPGQNRVTIDGQDQGAVEHVRCGTITDGVRIKIGMGDHGVVVILSDADPPAALGVQFSKTVQNGGVTLEYDSRKNEGNGEVTKQGNFYKITGTAVGKDSSGATQRVGKSFEIDVTCP